MSELNVHVTDRRWLTVAGNTIDIHYMDAVGPVLHLEERYRFNLHLRGSVVTVGYSTRDYLESEVEKVRRQVVEAWRDAIGRPRQVAL